VDVGGGQRAGGESGLTVSGREDFAQGSRFLTGQCFICRIQPDQFLALWTGEQRFHDVEAGLFNRSGDLT
jgi:hypothetical protein